MSYRFISQNYNYICRQVDRLERMFMTIKIIYSKENILRLILHINMYSVTFVEVVNVKLDFTLVCIANKIIKLPPAVRLMLILRINIL